MIPFKFLPLAALILLCTLAACKQEPSAPDPITPDVTIVASGDLVHGTMYDSPPTTPAIDRHHILFLGGKITLYSNDLVIITDKSGDRHAAPLEWCSDLQFK